MDFLRRSPHLMFFQVYLAFTSCVGGLLVIDLCRLLKWDAEANDIGRLVLKAVELAEKPFPVACGLPVVLIGFVAYRCANLGMPSYAVAQRWDGLPFRRAIPSARAATIELLSDVAVVELAARLLAGLWWTKLVIKEAMWLNQDSLAVAPALAAGGLAVDLLLAPAYIMYVVASYELFKAYRTVFPDAFKNPVVVFCFLAIIYCHVF
ncbi:hypothetical protein F5Y13DRAFT_197628 [Hypoxylon sp. FL1857]|nr:hypothetical protein F5Y13DRAFT_197628 [Hypoxylon sp. FL1857]